MKGRVSGGCGQVPIGRLYLLCAVTKVLTKALVLPFTIMSTGHKKSTAMSFEG